MANRFCKWLTQMIFKDILKTAQPSRCQSSQSSSENMLILLSSGSRTLDPVLVSCLLFLRLSLAFGITSRSRDQTRTNRLHLREHTKPMHCTRLCRGNLRCLCPKVLLPLKITALFIYIYYKSRCLMMLVHTHTRATQR
jgi:hypothetical protein